jgi:hypothetical protein
MPADDGDRDEHDGNDPQQGGVPLRPGRAFRGRAKCRVAPDHHPYREDVEQRRHEAGDQRGHEQLRDVLFRADRIDDEDDGGGDENAERPTHRDRAGGETGVVAVALQFGQRCAPEGRGRRDGGAADRTEGRAGADHAHRHAAGPRPNSALPREQVPRQPAALASAPIR